MIVILTHFLVSLPDRTIVGTVGSATKSSSPTKLRYRPTGLQQHKQNIGMIVY